MPNTKEILSRIKSVKNTSQITRAMQLVATSKMRRAQEAALSGRHYALLLAEIIASLAEEQMDDIQHPLLRVRDVQRRGILVVGTNKGLCGPLNANLFKALIDIESPAAYVAVGRKATQFLSRTRRDLRADFPLSDRVDYAEVRPIVEHMIQLYKDEKIDTIEILFSRYVNTLVQEPALLQLVPLRGISEALEELRSHLKIDLAHAGREDREFLFEPDVASVLEALPELYIKQQIYQRLLEAKASEHSARMVAMKSATDNASKLTDDLSLRYNKARQAAITQEILEIAAATATV